MRKITRWILVVGVVVLIWWLVYTPITTDNFLIKALVVCIFVTVVAPIMTFYVKAKAKSKLSNHDKKKVEKKQIDLSQYQAIKKIYKEEREQYYQEARTLFHDLAKGGTLTKQDLSNLRMLIKDCLGDYIHEYDEFEHEETVKTKTGEKKVMKKGFANIYHQIYCYLKSYYLNEKDWEKIINFLKSFETASQQNIN
jgi:hypothetical protein